MNEPFQSWTSSSPEETKKIAESILGICKNGKFFAIFGDLGAGKTTLVKFFCELLNSEDVVSSPTFSLVNEYASPEGPIFHFDLYRIKQINEVYDMGYEEYFFGDHFCFVEWPELIEELIPEHAWKIVIESNGENSRTLKLFQPSPA